MQTEKNAMGGLRLILLKNRKSYRNIMKYVASYTFLFFKIFFVVSPNAKTKVVFISTERFIILINECIYPHVLCYIQNKYFLTICVISFDVIQNVCYFAGL